MTIMMVLVREKRDIRPLLLKVGLALTLSLGGVIYSALRNKRIRHSRPPTAGGKIGTRNDHHGLKTAFYCCNAASIAPLKRRIYSSCHVCLTLHDGTYQSTLVAQSGDWVVLAEMKVIIDNTSSDLSPSSRYAGEKEGFLLPQINKLMNEFDLVGTKAGISPWKDEAATKSDVETATAFKCAESVDHEQEIKCLRNMVRILRESEKNLEIQLLEYYGLKEQETAAMELKNQLKINHMEAKLHAMKVESLQADNRRLEAQVADYAKVMTELEAERAKIKLLKKKLRSEAEQNDKQILTLQERVRNLQDREHKVVASDLDKQLKMQTLKHLEEEVEELRKSNQHLKIENSDLAHRLESTQILAISVLEDQEAEALKEESRSLRQENENLEKEIEQLQADRCTDAEELVYLRWINACLRYELRNYEPGTGKTIARDLSKTLSPKSEEKAKQLILEYADREGLGEKGTNVMEFDSDECSSSQSSYHTDSGEFDDSPVDNSSANKTKTSSKMKFFRKLRRLLRGQGSRHHSRSPPLKRTPSVGDIVEMYRDSPNCNSTASARHCPVDGRGYRSRTSSHSSKHSPTPEKSLDLIRLKSAKIEDNENLEGFCRKGDARYSGVYKRSLDREGVTDSSLENQPHKKDLESIQRSELLKYAEALKGSHGIPPKIPGRSMSYGSF